MSAGTRDVYLCCDWVGMKQQCVQGMTASQHFSGDAADLVFIQVQHLEPLQLSQAGWKGLHHQGKQGLPCFMLDNKDIHNRHKAVPVACCCWHVAPQVASKLLQHVSTQPGCLMTHPTETVSEAG